MPPQLPLRGLERKRFTTHEDREVQDGRNNQMDVLILLPTRVSLHTRRVAGVLTSISGKTGGDLFPIYHGEGWIGGFVVIPSCPHPIHLRLTFRFRWIAGHGLDTNRRSSIHCNAATCQRRRCAHIRLIVLCQDAVGPVEIIESAYLHHTEPFRLMACRSRGETANFEGDS